MEDLAANLVTKASLTGALPVNHLRKNDYSGYAQDEYKWLPNLTLNLGVRYTVFDLFHEENGLANPFDFGTCGRAGILRHRRQLRPAELRRYRSPRGLCLDAVEGRSRR